MRLFAKDKNGHFIREVNGIKLPFPLTEFMKVRFVGYAFSAILMAISLSNTTMATSDDEDKLPF